MTKLWAGVDIGGTKVAVALVDEQGMIVTENKIATEVEKGPDPIVHKITALLRKWSEEQDGGIAGIGVGSPGPLDAERGIIQTPSNLPTWHHYPVVEKIEEPLGIHTVLGNDADLAALAEFKFALKEKHQNVAYFTVSTGVGGGIISNGRLHHGSSSTAGEFGHMIMEKDGPLCGCGRRGCLESFSSGTGIARRMRDKVIQHPGHPLYAKAKAGGFTAKDVFIAYDEGDRLARLVIEQAENYLAIAMANAINALNPSVLILGGGVILGQPRYFRAVKEKTAQYAIRENLRAVRIVKARFQARAGVIGAAALAMVDEY